MVTVTRIELTNGISISEIFSETQLRLQIFPVFEKLPINDDIFTPEEYSKATMSIKCGISAGEDGIMPEVLKYVQINDIMLDIINKSFENCEQPEL